MLTDYQLFRFGFKPALLIPPRRKGYKRLRKRYPYTLFSNGQIVYFQNKKMKSEFDAIGFSENGSHLPFNEEVMGRFLGFPPIAIQDFINEIPREARIGIDYHGMSFVVHHDHVSEALDYLEKHMPIPKKVIKRYHSTIFICTVAFV